MGLHWLEVTNRKRKTSIERNESRKLRALNFGGKIQFAAGHPVTRTAAIS
jgi:hypothetical protein